MTYPARLTVGPGAGRLIRHPTHCLFVPESDVVPQHDMASEAAEVVAAFIALFRDTEASAQSLADFVLEHPQHAPSFAWVGWSGADGDVDRETDGRQIAMMVRGHLDITSNIDSVPNLSGANSPTWVEHRVRRCPATAEISLGSPADQSTDLTAGTIAAGGFTLLLGSVSPVDASAPTASRAEPVADPAPRGALVPGRRCPVDHANPPHLVRCRICDLPVDAEADTVTVQSPVLAVARFNNGSSVELAGTKVIGRRPTADRAHVSAVHDLVPIDAPSSVSRTHLIVAASGWLLTVTDCGSGSGTVLIDAQSPEPVQLQPWVPHELGVGDVVHLGGPTTMTIEDPSS